MFQSGRWYQMKNRPCAMATRVMTTSVWNLKARRGSVIAGDCSLSSQQLAVERLEVVHEPIDAVAGEHQSPATIAGRSPATWIGKERGNGACETGCVAEGRDLADRIAARRAHDVADAAHVGRDTGDSRRQAF